MGLRGTSTMRKPELLATLQAARSGGEAPAGVTVKAPKTSAPKASEPVEGKSEKAAEAKSKKQSDAAPAQADTAENTTRRDRTAAKDKAHEAVDLLATLDLDAAKEGDRKERKPRRRIHDELDGEEGILVASKIADRVGITRSVIVNALRKFESAGVIESRSSGMKGTYIKVLNEVIFDELEEIKAQRNKKSS